MIKNPESVYNTFDFPFDRDDEDSVNMYQAEMQDLREKAFIYPLTTTTVFSIKLQLNANHSPNARPIPWLSCEARENTYYTCRLLQPLRIGFDKPSQVWVAEVLRDDGNTSLQYADPHEHPKIVLKIFQQSLSRLPDFEGIQMMDGTYIVLEEHAKNEDRAYQIMEDLQGTYVPHYLGLHKITTPSGEEAWAIALEYIEGVDIQKLEKSCRIPKGSQLEPSKLEALCEAYRSATRTIRAIQDKDVHQLDKRPDNFIVMNGSNFVVGVDFAVTYFDMFKINRVLGMTTTCQHILDCFADYKDAVQSWVNMSMEQEFRDHVYMPPETYEEDD